MIFEKANSISVFSLVLLKFRDYAVFTKFRLSALVLFSALAGYWLAAEHFDWVTVFHLLLGGFLVTGASNGFNQVIEKDYDKLMSRTQNRPLPTGRMNVMEGLVLAGLMGFTGIFVLFYFLNPLSGILGALALITYTAIYTPMKRLSPLAVWVGAIPGAIPPMIGYVAVTGKMGLEPGILFAVQFFWQFPHFWAIAWKGDDDYKKAGFKLLPSISGKDKISAFQILISSILLIPVSLLPFYFGISGTISAIICLITSIWFLLLTIKFYKSLSDKDATTLMFASFIYLPIVLIAFVLDKL